MDAARAEGAASPRQARVSGTWDEVNCAWRHDRAYPRCKESKKLYREIYIFRSRTDPGELLLPPSLSRYLRGCAHNYAERLGLVHESVGDGKTRCVKLTLTATGAADPVQPLLSLDQPKKKNKPADPAAANIKWDRVLKAELDLCAAAEAKGRFQLEQLRMKHDEVTLSRCRAVAARDFDGTAACDSDLNRVKGEKDLVRECGMHSTVFEVWCQAENEVASAATKAIELYGANKDAGKIVNCVNLHMFNILLNVLSNAGRCDDFFVVYDSFEASKLQADTATIVALIKACAAKGETARAHESLLLAENQGMKLKLRCFSEVLKAHCRAAELDKAEAVFMRLKRNGFAPTEEEYAMMIEVCAAVKDGERLEELLIEMSEFASPQLEEATLLLLEAWFTADEANDWIVERGTVDKEGKCSCNGGTLRSIELSAVEQVELVQRSYNLGSSNNKESHKKGFVDLKEWLKEHNQWDIVLDGANIGFCNQSWEDGQFTLIQVRDMALLARKKFDRVLVVLHQKWVDEARASDDAAVQQACSDLEEYLYVPVRGTNDDWYWLYIAAVTGALVLTNDQMRDHSFAMLKPKYFLKWKERHQVFYDFVGRGRVEPHVTYPSSYSARVQREVDGSAWYLPLKGGTEWLCAYKRGRKRPREEAAESEL